MNQAAESQNGMTLIELVIVMVLVGLLASTAIPAFTELTESTRNRAEVNDLMGFLRLARQEAVRSGKTHTLCPLDSTGAACGKDWTKPVLLFEDPYSQRTIDTTTVILRTLTPPQRGTLTIKSLNSSYFQFKPDGRLGGHAGNITWCPDSGDAKHAAHIIISPAGRIRLATDVNNDGLVENSAGAPISCQGN